ncbi:MAG: hypothetical protein FRX48_00570 [Lasallia pustulata]|uniref:Ribosomal RNA-processing protein 7 n=1 Tax=Lasallia pustulata TaxID=136370 RepID=A0A5M8Q280_9LECA|nr:MAG: hypothetical protein FRX48_00570 [Lasallia pustulata]
MAPSNSIPSQVSDYRVLQIALPSLAAYPTPATHYLYVRNHEPKLPTPTTPRSLFLVNLPIDATEAHIKHLLSSQLKLPNGRIETVQFEGSRSSALTSLEEEVLAAAAEADFTKKKGKKRKRSDEAGAAVDLKRAELPDTWDRELHRSGSTAVVVFVDRASMDASLKAVSKASKLERNPVWGEGIEGKLPALGSARYLNHQQLRYPDKTQLLNSVNAYMNTFTAQEAARARLLARQRQEPDEDGFITVTRGGRSGPARQEEAQEKAEKQREKQKGLEDFYRFQTREKRKAKAGELVRKFQDDRHKLKEMRERRGRLRPES